jgi:UPF0716 protein FxsA
MFARLALLFILVPLAELALLVWLGQLLGLWPTLGVVAATGVVGAALARSQGLRAVRRIQGEMAAGRVPGAALLDGAAILVGGAFLLTPGILTDIAGFLLLLPPTRRWLRGRLRRALERRVETGDVQVFMTGSGMGGPWARQTFGGGARPDDPELAERKEIRVDPH